MLKRLLAHPLTRGMDINAPETTLVRREIIRTKPFLRRIYEEWYAFLARAVPPGGGGVLELGSGAGFIKERLPECITSEIFFVPGLDVVCDGCRLPVRDGSLRAIVMTDVFHHLPKVDEFLLEMDRCVRPGGVLALVEPWVTPWSRLIWGKVHHEPFLPEAEQWRFATSGPLSGANGALPWMVFQRDRAAFQALCPGWSVERILPMMPLRYLVSGGVSLRTLVPDWSHGLLKALEALPFMDRAAMFAGIVLRKRAA